jgi:hypothetical protein
MMLLASGFDKEVAAQRLASVTLGRLLYCALVCKGNGDDSLLVKHTASIVATLQCEVCEPGVLPSLRTTSLNENAPRIAKAAFRDIIDDKIPDGLCENKFLALLTNLALAYDNKLNSEKTRLQEMCVKRMKTMKGFVMPVYDELKPDDFLTKIDDSIVCKGVIELEQALTETKSQDDILCG